MGPPPGLMIDSDDGTEAVSSANSTNEANGTDAKSLIEKLLKQLLEAFTEGFEKSASSDSSQSSDAISSLASNADKNSSGGVSVDELSSIDTAKDSKAAGFINDLVNNFKSYDTDGDGQLSVNELKDAIKQTQFSQQDLADVLNSYKDDKNYTGMTFSETLGNVSGSFLGKLISAYKNGGLSNLASSFNVNV